MITLRRLDLVRQQSPATADELASLQTQLNAIPVIGGAVRTVHVTDLSPAERDALSVSAPAGVIELKLRGKVFLLPLFLKA